MCSFFLPSSSPCVILEFLFPDKMILEYDTKKGEFFFHSWIRLFMLTMGQCDREDTEGKENEKKTTISLQSLPVLSNFK